MKSVHAVNAKRDRDQRVRRTREAIVSAFNGIVLRQSFGSIQIGDIIDNARVGRSTFYEHFRNKEELLSHSATTVLGVLASAVDAVPDVTRVAGVLRHFRENRRMALEVLRGETGPLMQECLSELIAQRLSARPGFDDAAAAIPVTLAAAEIAGGQIGLVRAWLESRETCDADTLAASMCRTCAAVVGMLVGAKGSRE